MAPNFKKKVVLLSFFLLLISTFFYRSDICCMFNASRYYGWPSSFIVVNKSTEFLAEAKKVETENLISLLKNGWKPSFNANAMGQFGLSSSPVINLLSNYLLYLIAAYLLIKMI